MSTSHCMWGKVNDVEENPDSLTPSENLLNSYLENPEIPRLTGENAQACEGKLMVDECLKSIQSFENNKSVGIDKAFWNIVGNLMVIDTCFALFLSNSLLCHFK